MNARSSRILLLFCLACAGIPLFRAGAQLPEWKPFRDGEGNTYHVDPAGKIWTADEPQAAHRPVSLEGMEYHINHGCALLHNHYYIEGLTLLKSICAMPVWDQRIRDAQVRASKEMNRLKLVQGPRYDRYDEAASLLLFTRGGAVTVINDLMRYRLTAPGTVAVIRSRTRGGPSYLYYGVTLGLRTGSGKGDARAFDALLACDSERFARPVDDIATLEGAWHARLGGDAMERTVLVDEPMRRLYRIVKKDDPGLAGFEGIFLEGRFGHLLRILCPASSFEKLGVVMEKMLREFSTR